MGVCCKKKTMIGWRNVWNMKRRVPRGRPKKTWREIVEKDCRARGLNRDRSRWRKQIGMIDDHDELSGWMFLLVPAHPGCPGQIPQSRKMVVCVWEVNLKSVHWNGCMCVFVLRGMQASIFGACPTSGKIGRVVPGRASGIKNGRDVRDGGTN